MEIDPTLPFNPFIPKSAKPTTENKQHHLKVLLNSFNLNGHTLGFHPQTWKLEPHCFLDSRFDSGSERVKDAFGCSIESQLFQHFVDK